MFVKTVISFVFAAFIITLALPVFAAVPDANVKGLWLRCPGFPEDAETLEFDDNEEYGVTTYIRSLDDALLTFEIRRQPIEESELQKPDDAQGLIEMRVHNSDGDLDDMEIETHPSGISEHFSYPCATAQYTTGQNEDTRKNASLFIFTDAYCFEVEISATADSFEEYENRMAEWLTALEFVEDGVSTGGGNSGESAMSDEDFLELCKGGSPREVTRAIDGGANLNARDDSGETPLHRAAYFNGNLEVVKALIEAGAEVDARDEKKRTPLMHAVQGVEGGNVIALLDAGADADLEDDDGKKAIDHARSEMPSWADENVWKAAMARLADGDKSTATTGNAMSDEDFLELCKSGTPEEVERAIRGGVNVNAADEDDWTALHFAALNNDDPAVVEILLENGANIDARDNTGDTPLINAAVKDSPKHIFLLLDRGADAGITNNDGKKALDYLSESKPDEVDEEEWKVVVERLK